MELKEPKMATGRAGHGVLFLAAGTAEPQRFLVTRESLTDLEGTRENPVDLVPLFEKHKNRIAVAADKALAYGYKTGEAGWVVLDSRLFGRG